jgi:RimJ/RimL family protein N-acetyltransferase
VAAVIACVRPDNSASLAVLDRLGGFEQIGACRDGDDDELVFRLDLT